MFTVGPATRIYLAPGPTDLRQGFNGLSARAQQVLTMDPLSGHLFVFCNRNRSRLEKGRFSWPAVEEGMARVNLRAEELTLLLGGIELERTRAKEWWRREGK